MQKRVVIKNGKKYIVNAPGWNDEVGPGVPPGVLWMLSTDGNWYEVTMTGTSGSTVNSASFSINQTPLTWVSNDSGYQFLYCNDDKNIYQVYLSGSAGGVNLYISQSAYSTASIPDYKPYLLMQSTTDSYFYPVYAQSGSIFLTINENGRTWMGTTAPTRDTTMGSYQFGDINQFLTASADVSFAAGTGSFTVEWYQRQTFQTAFSRPFTLKPWPNAELGVSIESGNNFYLWMDALGNTPATANAVPTGTPYLNRWVHFAVVRESGSFIRVFQNGQIRKTITGSSHVYITANINNVTSSFIVGGEGDNVANTRFSGSITNLRFVTGSALYSASFKSPVSPLTAVPGTVLLLLANSGSPFVDSSVSAKPIYRNSVSWSAATPF